MRHFVRETIQGTFCSYFMEITSIVYIYRHICTTSSYCKHYHWTVLGSLQNRTVSGTHAKGSGQQTQKGSTTTISCTTAARHVPGRESSMTNVGYTERLLTYTLICQTTRKKRNPNTTSKSRNYDRCYLYCRQPC